jgi:Xaa-Pro dipeptidase
MQLDAFKLERTRSALSRIDVDCALFTDFYNVSYLTGYTQFFENGPSPFTRGAAACLLTPGKAALIAEVPEEEVNADGWVGHSIFYEGYNFRANTPPMDHFVQAVVETAARELPQRGRVGIEKDFLPASVYERLQAIRPNVEWVALPYMLMMNVRAVKSLSEIMKLRDCARLCEVGQMVVRDLVQEPGMSEIEIYSQAKAHMEQAVKGRFALQDALHSGLNSQSPFPGMPTGYVPQRGDLIISDMVPYYNGYWGDSCSSYVVGGADAITDTHRAMHKIALEAFEIGFRASKPGVMASEIDALVRGHIAKHGYKYPHHTGHGVGVSNQDEPRIIIGGLTPLEAGMVVVIEPPVYKEGFGGLRLERMYLIKDNGPELIAHNPFDLA